MGETVLPTLLVQSEAVKTEAKRGGESAKRPLGIGMPQPQNIISEVRQEAGGAAH